MLAGLCLQDRQQYRSHIPYLQQAVEERLLVLVERLAVMRKQPGTLTEGSKNAHLIHDCNTLSRKMSISPTNIPSLKTELSKGDGVIVGVVVEYNRSSV
jgi:hypothetical protein